MNEGEQNSICDKCVHKKWCEQYEMKTCAGYDDKGCKIVVDCEAFQNPFMLGKWLVEKDKLDIWLDKNIR